MPAELNALLLVAVAVSLYVINRKYLSYKTNQQIDEVVMILKKDVVEANFTNIGTGKTVRHTLQVKKHVYPHGAVRYKKKIYRVFPDCGTRLKSGLMSYEWIVGLTDPIDRRHPKYCEDEAGYNHYIKPMVYIVPEGIKPITKPRRCKTEKKKGQMRQHAFISPWLEYKAERICPATPYSDTEETVGYDTGMFDAYQAAGREDNKLQMAILGASVVAAITGIIILGKMGELLELLNQILGKL